MVETWALFAISFAFFHALVTVFDKIVLNNKSIDSLTLSTFRLGTNAAFGLIIVMLFFELTIPSSNVLLNVVLLSLTWLGAVLFYFIPLKFGDVSQLIPIREVIATFLSFSLAIVLLSEVASVYDLVGTLAIIAGGYILLTDGRIILPKISKAVSLIAVDGLFLAISGIVAKPVSLMMHPVLLNFYMYSFVFVFLIAINSSTNYRNQLKTFGIILKDKKVLILSIGASLAATIGTVLLFYGLTLGQATEVLPITRILPVFAVLMGWLALKEKSGMVRFIGSITTFAGVYLIII